MSVATVVIQYATGRILLDGHLSVRAKYCGSMSSTTRPR
jgi:hypothetical protein